MASLVEGKLSFKPIAPTGKSGEFQREESGFHKTVSPNEANPGRYHLYVSYACPWAHRTIITRSLKKLTNVVAMSVANPYMSEKGWMFSGEMDPKYLAELYLETNNKYTGKVTVPVLWDNKKKEITNNESSEILRILNSSFDDCTDSTIDLYPEHLRDRIDHVNTLVYENVNNGVYKAGFATTQSAYEKACMKLFSTLDQLDKMLAVSPFLVGDKITEADIRLFTTLYRFDAVYYVHFKCNIKRIKDYEQLYNYLKSLYQIPEIRRTCHMDQIKEHYYKSHPWINPSEIIPLGPEDLLDEPHNRLKVEFFT